MSFNPRPLLLTGESPEGQPVAGLISMFQSTPVIANGRIGGHAGAVVEEHLFQSTPVIANGRIADGGEAGAVGNCVSIHARYC